MKKLSLLVVLVVAAGCDMAPQVKFADGTQTQMSHWQDRWLVINYWAEWCGPCRDEIPELNELHKRRVGHGLVVLGVNWDGVQGDKLRSVVERMQIAFPVLLDDPYQTFGYERAQQLPMTVVISPRREVAAVMIGPQTADSILAVVGANAGDAHAGR